MEITMERIKIVFQRKEAGRDRCNFKIKINSIIRP